LIESDKNLLSRGGRIPRGVVSVKKNVSQPIVVAWVLVSSCSSRGLWYLCPSPTQPLFAVPLIRRFRLTASAAL